MERTLHVRCLLRLRLRLRLHTCGTARTSAMPCMHAWYEWHAWLPAEFAHGELFEILEDDQSLPEEVVQGIAKQLVRALHYLHSNRIIHR